MGSGRNSKLFKRLWLTLLPARMKRIHSKLKALERSQHFSHYKSMGIFSDAQGQVTHKSLIRPCQILNPSEILWVSLLPARMKKIQLKMKGLERSQHYSLIFQTLKGSLLQVNDGTLPKFKPIQAFVFDLVTCKNEEDLFQIESIREVTTFLLL